MSNIIPTFTDAELFTMFNVDCGQFIEATNGQVAEADRLDPKPLYGKDLWNCTFPRKRSKVVDPSAMTPEELQRCRKQEQAERAAKLAELYASGEADGVDNITSLLPEPTYR